MAVQAYRFVSSPFLNLAKIQVKKKKYKLANTKRNG